MCTINVFKVANGIYFSNNVSVIYVDDKVNGVWSEVM